MLDPQICDHDVSAQVLTDRHSRFSTADVIFLERISKLVEGSRHFIKQTDLMRNSRELFE